jgi:Signal transduction histidine kinase regulating citrate/malate metabolism
MENPQSSADFFLEMVQDQTEERTNILEQIYGLLDANAYDALLAYINDPRLNRYLLEDEVAYIRMFCTKRDQGPSRLN